MSGFEGSDIRTMVMFGQGEDAGFWVDERVQSGARGDVTRFVLFTAAQFGQVKTLEMFVSKGDLKMVDDQKPHIGWNLYHYAVQGYQMNCNYLVSSPAPSQQENPNLPSTYEQARETQLDILYVLGKGGALPEYPQLGEKPPDHPPHPSQMALDPEYNFLEAAYLIDIMVILMSDPNSIVPTPGLQLIQVDKKKEYKIALHHLMKWSYDRRYHDVLGYCHDRYHSICGDIPRLQPGNYPMFLHAVLTSNIEVIKLVFDHVEKRPLPDRLMSRTYDVGQGKTQRKASAVSLLCEMSLEGNLNVFPNLIHHIGDHLVNISLSDLQLEAVPLCLFHERLNSLSLSNNKLKSLPPVSLWKCNNLVHFSLEFNRFQKLPTGIFSMLPNLETLNVANNEINEVEVTVWRSPSLKTLYLNKNHLRTFPCPELWKVDREDLDNDGKTKEKLLPKIFGISHSFVNRGVQRPDDRYKSVKGYNLQWLDLSDNELVAIPNGLPCLAPQLRTLKLSRNKIVDFGHVSDYPSTLRSLELIRNNATSCVKEAKSEVLQCCLQSQPTHTINCSHKTHTVLSELHHLNVSKNNLTWVTLEQEYGLKSPTVSVSVMPRSHLLFPNLQSLSCSHNSLTSVPEGVHKLTSLLNLDISHNEGITQLPLKICQLKELDGFNYKGISDPIVKQLDNCKDIGRIRHFLRARQTETVQNVMMRINVIGHHKKGKSTLVRAIRKYASPKKTEFFPYFTQTSDPSDDKPTHGGMHADTWPFTKKRLASGDYMSFCVWEFGGKEENYPVHECFLTSRALYLLVWRITDREMGINGLGVWLRILQAKAPGAQVIIVGTHMDSLTGNDKATLHRMYQQVISDMYGKPPDPNYPTIRRICFVGQEESKFSSLFGTNKYDELVDVIFDEALKIEIPKTRDMKPNFHMKILEEQLPKTYLDLEEIVYNLRYNRDKNIMTCSEFCELAEVKNIIEDPSEVDIAMDTLHNRGTVFHFHMNVLEGYYILNTQWWFEACELVVSPDVGNLGDSSSSGILSFDNMMYLFKKNGLDEEHAKLVFHFLHQHEVILPIDSKSALVPSLLHHIPMFKLLSHPGMFPWGSFSIDDSAVQHSFHEFKDYVPAAAMKSLPSNMKVRRSGLILRRMFLLPPISLNFWNRVINLCLQKDDFPKIVRDALGDDVPIIPFDHGLFYQISNCQMRWKYWRTGIVLELNHEIILSINSLQSNEFIDPTAHSAISDTFQKASRFKFFDANEGYIPLDDIFPDIFEVVVPEILLECGHKEPKAVSPKILVKSLEIIDEVLRGYSNDLSEDGIFTLSNMCHVIPCPICFGDRDNRPPATIRRSRSEQPRPRLGSTARQALHNTKYTRIPNSPDSVARENREESIIVFSIDQCIEAAVTGAEYIECPVHKLLRLDRLAPDIVYNDILNLKLDISYLNNPPGNDGTPVGQGCFGIVYHKLLNDTLIGKEEQHVALKEFVVDEMMAQTEMDEVKKYSDMRYEINKLTVLKHDYIVEFVGVVARPPSFVLEWAPLMSLEKIRAHHERQRKPICPVSLYVALLQVLDGLHYLHAPPVGIIHSDLKLSNILAFRFTDVNHTCCHSEGDRGRCVKAMPELDSCGVLVKLGDMGVCINPTGHDTGDNLGVKRFAPECNISTVKTLTEKVDIFCLGICVYELLTLKGLPPKDYSEMEYRKMLAKGWRPLFHLKDTNYPLPLNLFIEQCWEQDYTKRPSAQYLKDFLEGITGISVERKFEVDPRGRLSLNHCLDGYMLVSENQEVTAFRMLSSNGRLLVYLGICEDGENKVVSLEAVKDDETNKQFFKSKIINQAADEKVTAIYITPALDAILGYQGGRVTYVKDDGSSFPQTTPGNLCNRDFEHGAVNFIDYVAEEELIVTGFTDGFAHIMKVQVRHFGDMFLKGFYCCEKKSVDLKASGFYAVVNKPNANQLEVWCGCSNSHIETWNFCLPGIQKWRQALVKKTVDQISLRHPNYTPHSSLVCNMAVTPDRSSVFALIGDTNRHGIIAICQIDSTEKKPLRYWQCDMGVVSYFSVTTTDLIVGTIKGESQVFPLEEKLMKKDVYKASCEVSVLCHAGAVSQLVILDGFITQEGYTSMFHSYLGVQEQATPCKFIVSIGKGFINPSQFNPKAPKNTANERDGYCVSVWAV